MTTYAGSVVSMVWVEENQVDDLICGQNGTVVRDIDVERGVHHLVRVVCRRIPHHRHVVAELGGIANGRFDAGMRYEPDDDELMDARLLELQIQIGVGEAAPTPMLRGNNLARLRRELGTELAAPRTVFEALALPRRPLDRRDVFPVLVVTRAVSVTHGIEDLKLCLPCGVQHLQHVRNAIVGFRYGPDAGPHLAALGDEVVVRIDHQECGEMPIVCHVRRGLLSHAGMQVASYEFGVSTCVTGEDVVAIFSGLVAGEAGSVHRLAGGFAVLEISEPPATRRGVFS